jgi:hypothetical protein
MASASSVMGAMGAHRGLVGVADRGLSLLAVLSMSASKSVRVFQVMHVVGGGRWSCRLLV